MKNELFIKIKTLQLRFWPVIFILAVWLVFSSPYFFQQKVPYPSTYQVNHFQPWSAYEKYGSAVKNDAMPDIIDEIYPWRKLTIESWKSIGLPVWNPYNFAGNPHLANYQSAVFSPFNILFFIFPFIDAWSLLVLFQPLIAGIGGYAFSRSLGTSKIGSLISGITFMFCGFIVTWMAYGTLSLAISFLPWGLFSLKRFLLTHKKLYLVFLALIIPSSFFSGHFQTSLYFFLFVLTYVVYEFAETKKRNIFLPVVISIIAGLMIALLQILPSIEFYNYSVRSSILLNTGGISWYYLVTSFAPDFFGNPVTRNNWYGFYAEWASFVGVIPLLLASFVIKKQKEQLFFIGTAVVSLLLATGFLQPIITFLRIPVLSTSIPSRAIVLFSFSVAVLSGFGWDTFLQLISKKAYRKILPQFIFFSVLFVGIIVYLRLFSSLPHEKISIAIKNMVLPLGLFTVFFLLGFIAIRYKKLIGYIGIIVILLVSFDSLHFASKWMPFDPKNLVFPDVPVIKAIKDRIGFGRIYGNLGAQIETYYGISSIEGYDPLYVERIGELLMSAASGKYTPAERSVAKLNRNGKYTDKVLDLFGVNLVFQPSVDTGQGWAFPVWANPEKYKLIYQDDRFQLYQNLTALPRAKVFYTYDIISDKKKEVETLLSDAFDIDKKILLEEKPELPSLDNNSESNVMIQSYQPNKIIIDVKSSKPGFLFLSDTYYPNWHVKVNGKEEKIYRADYALRAVEIPEGKSDVVFTYAYL